MSWEAESKSWRSFAACFSRRLLQASTAVLSSVCNLTVSFLWDV